MSETETGRSPVLNPGSDDIESGDIEWELTCSDREAMLSVSPACDEWSLQVVGKVARSRSWDAATARR